MSLLHINLLYSLLHINLTLIAWLTGGITLTAFGHWSRIREGGHRRGDWMTFKPWLTVILICRSNWAYRRLTKDRCNYIGIGLDLHVACCFPSTPILIQWVWFVFLFLVLYWLVVCSNVAYMNHVLVLCFQCHSSGNVTFSPWLWVLINTETRVNARVQVQVPQGYWTLERQINESRSGFKLLAWTHWWLLFYIVCS